MIILFLIASLLAANEYTEVRIDMSHDLLKDEIRNVMNIKNPHLLELMTPILENKINERGREALHNADVMKKYVTECIEESFNRKEIQAAEFKINSENNIRRARIAACANIATCVITAAVILTVQLTECEK